MPYRPRPEPPESRSLRRRTVAGFQVTEALHPAGARLPRHSHEGPTICCVLHGAFHEESGGGTVTCTPRTLKVTPAGDPHTNHFDMSDAHGLMIEVEAPGVERLQPHADLLAERLMVQGGPLAALALRIRRELQETDEAAPLAMEGLLLELIAQAERRHHTAPEGTAPWLQRARDLLHDDPAGRHSLSTIAGEVDVHPVTLARAFRSAYGCTVGQYLRNLRMRDATRLLQDTEDPIASVALAAGYADQSHFSNAFRRETGITPGRFRALARG